MPLEGKPYPIELGGLKTSAPASRAYPGALIANNVRWKFGDILAKRGGTDRYNTTAMADVSAAKEPVLGLFKFNRRDTTTRYLVACTTTRILTVPTSGAWTALVSGMSLTSSTNYWDACVFNNEMILVNGKEAPRVTDGTAGGTGTLTARAWQTKTASPVAQSRSCGMKAIDMEGELYNIGGSSNVTTTYDGFMQVYDPDGDSWRTAQRTTLNRTEGQSFQAYGKLFVTGGRQASTTYSLTGEMYNPETETWTAITSMPVEKVTGRGCSTGGFGYAVCGSTTNAAAGGVATNYKYDPAIDAWSTMTAYTTARRYLGAFEISGRNYIVGGQDTAGNLLATTQSFDTNAGALVSTAAGSLATATDLGDATAGNDDGKGYFAGGELTGATGTAINDVYSFDFTGNAWTAETDMTTATVYPAMGTSGRWIYVHGGESTGGGAAALATMQRMNTSPAAPAAYYVKSFKGYVFMARSDSFPSRVWYSGVGDSRYWDPNAFFDVNPDDGDWITGLFVFDGRLYVSKIGQMYQVTGGIFDPEEGDQGYIPLENVPGATGNRSIVVTDTGAYYLAKAGFQRFDGSRSVGISGDIDSAEGSTYPREKWCTGVWNRDTNEIWWCRALSSSGEAWIYNYQYNKWSKWQSLGSGVGLGSVSSITIIEDSNDAEIIVLGSSSTTDGHIYKINESSSSDTDPNGDARAVVSTYQTGWYAPSSVLGDCLPQSLYLLSLRSASCVLSVDTYVDYGSSSRQTDSIQLYNQATPVTDYFQDTSDKRCRIQMGGECSGHVISHKFANNLAGQSWQIEGAIMVGKDGSVTSNP